MPSSAQPGRRIEGQVFQEGGSRQPLSGIRVTLVHAASRQPVGSAVTAAHGEYQFYDMTAEDHLLRFVDGRPCPEAHASREILVTGRELADRGVVTKNAFLRRGAIIAGVVTDAQDRPLDGASVSVSPDTSLGGGDTTTNPSGRFQVCRLTPGNYTVTAAFRGAHTTVPNVRVAEGERRAIEIVVAFDQPAPTSPATPPPVLDTPQDTEGLADVIAVAQVATPTPAPGAEEAPELPETGAATFLLYATAGTWVVLGGMLLRQSARRRYRLLVDLDGYV